jgi:MFS family permease
MNRNDDQATEVHDRDEAAARPAPWRVVLAGIVGLAAAMGIGRFAFTPLLPLMQAEGSLPLAAGGWLAAANYLGYLAGALACMRFAPGPRRAVRGGLIAVALGTAAMGLVEGLAAWLVLRLVAGAASAFVLVGVSQWALTQLAGRALAAGAVFAGVGIGIVFAGAAGLEAAMHQRPAAHVWLWLGLAAAAAAAAVWRSVGRGAAAPRSPSASPRRVPGAGRLVFAYGALGFGYIIPATFLPAIAREQLADPLQFGWIWPTFGLAAAVSTVVAARWLRAGSPRVLWIGAQVLMAAGVAAPALGTELVVLLFSAVCIGGTFMVITMAGMQEAQRLAAPSAGRLMAAMTAAFAVGQLLGPLSVTAAAGTSAHVLVVPSAIAAAMLLAGAAALAWRRDARRESTNPRSSIHGC